MTIAEAQELARWLAQREARCGDDVDDLNQEGLIAWLKKDEAEMSRAMAITVMRRAMWRANLRSFKNRHLRGIIPGETLESIGKCMDESLPSTVTRACRRVEGEAFGNEQAELEMREYFEALEKQHGSAARQVAENLVSPRDLSCCRALVSENKRKQEQRAAGEPVRGVLNEIRLSQRAIREALGIPRNHWQTLMGPIKDFTHRWLNGAAKEE